MPFNGAGTFTRVYNWVTDRINGIKILADRVDTEMDGIATALSMAICRDGQSTVISDIPFNGRKITGLATATDPQDALNQSTGDGRYIKASGESRTIGTSGNLNVTGTATAGVVNAGTATFGSGGTTGGATMNGPLQVNSSATFGNSLTTTEVIFSTNYSGIGTTSLFGGLSAGTLRIRNDSGGIFFGFAGLPYYNMNVVDFRPTNDGLLNLGWGSGRFANIFAASGVVSTSDAREKADRAGVDLADTFVPLLTPAEIAAAGALLREIGVYKFRASVAFKGAGARLHVGMTVQRAIAIMVAHGLDPMAYGFICFDEWDAVAPTPAIPDQPEIPYQPAIVDDDGVVVTPEVAFRPAVPGYAATSGLAAGNRYSFRVDELLLFVARGFESRLSTIEAQLAA
jgi:hypothetical protein